MSGESVESARPPLRIPRRCKDCTCGWAWRSLGRVHDQDMGEAWVRATTDRACPHHGDDHRVECDCGYVVERLSRERAERFAAYHRDDECDPRVTPPEVTPTRHHTVADTLAAEDRVRAEDGHIGGRL